MKLKPLILVLSVCKAISASAYSTLLHVYITPNTCNLVVGVDMILVDDVDIYQVTKTNFIASSGNDFESDLKQETLNLSTDVTEVTSPLNCMRLESGLVIGALFAVTHFFGQIFNYKISQGNEP